MQPDLDNIEPRLTEMENKIDAIDKKIDGQGSKLNQVVDAIVGNPLTKTGGFMQKLENLEQRVQDVERRQLDYDDFKKKVYWGIAGVIGVGIVIEFLTNVYANVAK